MMKASMKISHHELKQYPVIRYGTPLNYYFDIMDRIGAAFEYEDLEYEVVESEGIPIRVATIETLIKLKENTVRIRDKSDVMLLRDKLKRKNDANL